MKLTSGPVYDAIRGDHAVYARPYLVAEWNLNMFSSVTAENTPLQEEDGYDVELFPIESIIDANRPTKGVVKARVNEAQISNGYETTGQPVRYYIGDRDDVYKYWCSPYPTNGSGVMPDHTDSVTSCRPQIEYAAVQQANKIVITFENTFASPDVFRIYIQTTVGGGWTLISTSPAIQNDGQVILYNESGGWTDAGTLANSIMTDVAGVKLEVDSMTGGIDRNGNATYYTNSNSSGTGYTTTLTTGNNAFCNVIEMSARREEDLTPWLIGVNDTQDISTDSPITPIGSITSNVATLNLSNTDLKFNKSVNPEYAELLDANVKFHLQYVYYDDITFTNEIGRVDQFTMRSEGRWSGEGGLELQVNLRDGSKYLQEVKPRPALFENLPVEQIVWRICDQIGFVDYDVTALPTSVPTRIPYWWCSGEETAWELFDDLAKSTQTAIYFDHNNRLQIKNREAAYNSAATKNWTIYGPADSYPAGVLPDAQNIEAGDEMQSNKITVNYQKTDISEWNNGHPKMDVVWQPEGTVTLRAADLRRDISNGDTFIWINSESIATWPYEGIVNVEGELIKYNGKQFVYYDGGTRMTKVVNDKDEYEFYNNKTALVNRYKNSFSGGLFIEERGYWNSEQKNHNVDTVGNYSVRSLRDGTRRVGVSGFRHHPADSKVSLRTNPTRFDANDLLIATKGAQGDSGWYYAGTSVKFVADGRKHQQAGLVINNSDNDESGYYVELTMTSKLNTKKARSNKNEIRLFRQFNDGSVKQLSGLGTRAFVTSGKWYDIDLQMQIVGSNHVVSVWLNGKRVIQETITGTDKTAFGGRFGMFVRGDTNAEFEYLYGISRLDKVPDDDVSFFDIVDGGYRSSQWNRDWVYRWRENSRRKRKRTGREQSRYNQMFFDEFGPIVHEVREFEVKFDPYPVTESRLFSTNVANAVMTEYRSDPFGCTFVLANASRGNAVLNGNDALFAPGTGESVDQVLAVIGRLVVQEDAQQEVVTNDEMVRRRGVIETEIDSQWIQSEGAAKRLGEWIEGHWSLGADTLTVQLFGNPLIELTDVVGVTDNTRGLDDDNYFVTNIQTSFDKGLQTTVTLRRVV